MFTYTEIEYLAFQRSKCKAKFLEPIFCKVHYSTVFKDCVNNEYIYHVMLRSNLYIFYIYLYFKQI